MKRLRSLRTAIILAAVVLLALLLVVLLDVSLTFQRLTQSLTEQRTRLENVQIADNMLTSVMDMQTASRGFIITNDKRFMAPFEPGRRQFEKALENALIVYATDEIQLPRLKALQSLEAHWRETYLLPLISQRAAAGNEADVRAVVSIVASGRGNEMVNQMRGIISNIREHNAAAMERANASATAMIADTRRVLLRSVVFFLTVLLFMIGLLVQMFNRLTDRNAALANEIGQRELAQKALTRASAMLNAVHQNAPYSVLAVDSEGRISSVNRAAEDLLGWPASDLVGHMHLQAFIDLPPTFMTVTAEGVRLDMRSLNEAAKREPGNQIVTKLHRRDGTELDVALALGELLNESGSVQGHVVMAHDVSELQAVAKLKAEFVSTVSHELRTPLTAVVGALALAKDEEHGKLDPQTRRFIDIAAQNSERLATLVDDLLDMEKMASGKMTMIPRMVSLPDFLREAVELNQSYAQRHGARFEIVEPIPAGHVRADPHRLHQVMANLLSNAAKFSPACATVRINTSVINRNVRVSVIDQGQGIPAEFRSQVFTRFARAENQSTAGKGGTGLGLYISKAIIEQLGGNIGFDSPPPDETAGSCFWFELPFAPTPAER